MGELIKSVKNNNLKWTIIGCILAVYFRKKYLFYLEVQEPIAELSILILVISVTTITVAVVLAIEHVQRLRKAEKELK